MSGGRKMRLGRRRSRLLRTARGWYSASPLGPTDSTRAYGQDMSGYMPYTAAESVTTTAIAKPRQQGMAEAGTLLRGGEYVMTLGTPAEGTYACSANTQAALIQQQVAAILAEM